MSVLDIVKHPDPILREESQEVEVFDEELKNTIADMIETMHAANGIGLAGVQVAYLKRVLVIDIAGMDDEGSSEERAESAENKERPSEPEAFINPEIIEKSGARDYEEGCLSIPGVYASVERSSEITVRYQDVDGNTYEEEMDGIKAIVLQHEIDHLNGVLFFDHLGPMKRSMLLSKYKKLRAEQEEDEPGS